MKTADKIVELARDQKRLTTREWIEYIFSDFVELKGDRCFGDDAAIVGGIAFFNEQPVTIIGTQKGHDLASNLETHFGMPLPEGYRKAKRLMQQAEKFNRPIITFVNTAGAHCSSESESRGIGEAIASNLLLMSQLTVPIITFIIGEGGSGGALALAVSNKVYMLEHSMYAILSPEGFATILWKDGARAKEASQLMKITPDSLMTLGVIDGIVRETKDEVYLTHAEIAEQMKDKLKEDLAFFQKMDKQTIQQHRQVRFRQY